MSNKNIPVMGVLHSVDADGVVAVAEEIEVTLPDKTKKKLSSELLNYAKIVTSDELANFISTANLNNIKDDYLFICKSSTNSEYKVGHQYYYNGSTKSFIDITPETSGTVSENTKDTISYYLLNDTVVNFNWTSVNAGYGTVYLLVDGLIVDSKKMLQGSDKFDLTDYCDLGKHSVSLYVMDSGNNKSSTSTFTVVIGNYKLSSTFVPKNVYSIDDIITIPYTYTIVSESSSLDYSLLYSIDDGEVLTVADSGELVVSGLTAGYHTINMQVQTVNTLTNEKITTNKLTFTIPLVINGVIYTLVDSPSIVLGNKSQKIVNVKVASTVLEKYKAELKWYKNDLLLEDLTTTYDFYNGTNSVILSNSNIGQYTLIFSISGKDDNDVEYLNELATINLTIENETNKNISPDNRYVKKYSASGITNNQWQRDYLFGGEIKDLSYIDNGYEDGALHLSDLGYVEIDNPIKNDIDEATFVFNIQPVFGTCVSSIVEGVGIEITEDYAKLSNINSSVTAYLNKNVYNHIVFAISKTNKYMAIYIDGKLIAYKAIDAEMDTFANNLDKMILGGKSECYIKEIRFYDFAMTDREVVLDYCASRNLSSEKDEVYRANGFADNLYSTLPSVQVFDVTTSDEDYSDVADIEDEINNNIEITEIVSGLESAYIKFVAEESAYDVYYKKLTDVSFTKLNDNLVVVNGNEATAYLVGLQASNYICKIYGKTDRDKNVLTTSFPVYKQDRSGYAHFNYVSGIGAYNDNGTLKETAKVIYVTEANKNTVTLNINGEIYTGLASILQAQQSSKYPLCVRIVGKVGAPTWHPLEMTKYTTATNETVQGLNEEYLELRDYTESEIISGGFNTLDETLYSKLNGLTNYIKYDETKHEFDSYYNMLEIYNAKNVTIEGVTNDAELIQFGFKFWGCQSIEVRNLTFTDYPEDAVSFDGLETNGEISSVSDFGSNRIWIHNNTFNIGKNVWVVNAEQDKHYGDGCADLTRLAYVTISYNHFNKTRKTMLIGGNDNDKSACYTLHHNYFDKSYGRLPLIRQANAHIYNNLYSQITNSTMSARANAYIFSENNYYDTAYAPETRSGAVVKSYNDYFKNNAGACTEVSNRETSVTNVNSFNQNFDTDSTYFYYKDGSSNVMYLTDKNYVTPVVVATAGAHKYAYFIDKNTVSTNILTENLITIVEKTDGSTSVNIYTDYIKINNYSEIKTLNARIVNTGFGYDVLLEDEYDLGNGIKQRHFIINVDRDIPDLAYKLFQDNVLYKQKYLSTPAKDELQLSRTSAYEVPFILYEGTDDKLVLCTISTGNSPEVFGITNYSTNSDVYGFSGNTNFDISDDVTKDYEQISGSTTIAASEMEITAKVDYETENDSIVAVTISDSLYNDINGVYLNIGNGRYKSNNFTLEINDLDGTFEFTSETTSFTLQSNVTVSDSQTVIYGTTLLTTPMNNAQLELSKLLRYLDEGDSADFYKHFNVKSVELLYWLDKFKSNTKTQDITLVSFANTTEVMDETEALKYGTREWYVLGNTLNSVAENKLFEKFVEYVGSSYDANNYAKFRDILMSDYTDELYAIDKIIPAMVYNLNIKNLLDYKIDNNENRYNLGANMLFSDTRYKYVDEYTKTATFTPSKDATLSFTITSDHPVVIYIDETPYLIENELDIAIPVVKNRQVVLRNVEHIKSIGDLSDAEISELDVTNMIALEELYIRNSKLTSLDVSKNTRLRVLDLTGSYGISEMLDLSNNNYLETVNTADTTITYVNIKNNSNIKNITLSDQTKTIKLYGTDNIETFDISGTYDNLTTVKTDNTFVSNKIINNWTPTKSLVNIDMVVDGDLSNTAFLDKCVELKQNADSTVKLSGSLNVTAKKVPNRYSSYSILGLTDITYPNITDLSCMFENYKNLNKISGGQIVSPYTALDVAEDIKNLLAPLKQNTIKDIHSMFSGCKLLTRILDDTFDGFTFSVDCDNYGMFKGCENLEYVKLPQFTKLGHYMFDGTKYAVIYIPKTVNTVLEHTFDTVANSHNVYLFEDAQENIDYITYGVFDAKFNVDENLQTERRVARNVNSYNTSTNNYIDIEYFTHTGTDDKLILSIKSKNTYRTLFVNYTNGNYIPELPNDFVEFLPGSLSAFSNLSVLCIPNICIKSVGNMLNVTPTIKDYSIARLFNKSVTDDTDIANAGADTVYIVTQNNCDIQNNLFENNQKIKNVFIYGPVYSFGEYSFANSNVNTLTINDTSRLTKISAYALYNSSISVFTVPDTVTEIGVYAFAKNNFSYFEYNDLDYIPDGCFSECNNTRNGMLYLNNNIKSIGDRAFEYSNNLVKSYDISKLTKLETIGEEAFKDCDDIKKIYISDNMKSIKADAFTTESTVATNIIWDLTTGYSYKLEIESGVFGNRIINSIVNGETLSNTFLVPENVTLQSNVANEVDLLLVKDNSGAMIDSNSMVYDEVLYGYDSYIDVDGSRYLLLKDNKAIYNKLLDSSATVVTIPATINGHNVTEIDNEAFVNSDSLQSIICEANITRIGKHIFEPNNIHNLQLPDTVTYIGCGTDFKSTPWYRSLLLDDYVYIGTTCIGYSEYQTDINHTDKTIKAGTTDIYDYAFYNEHMLTINLPDTLVRLHQDSLAGNDFNTIDLKNVKYIGDRALDECEYLTSIVFPASVTHIGSSVISLLTNIEYEDGCVLDDSSILVRPFITNLKIPNSLRVYCDTHKDDLDNMTMCTGLILGEYEVIDNKITPSNTYTGAYFDISHIDGMSADDISRIAFGFANDGNYHTLYCNAEQMATIRPYISDIQQTQKVSFILRQD